MGRFQDSKIPTSVSRCDSAGDAGPIGGGFCTCHGVGTLCRCHEGVMERGKGNGCKGGKFIRIPTRPVGFEGATSHVCH